MTSRRPVDLPINEYLESEEPTQTLENTLLFLSAGRTGEQIEGEKPSYIANLDILTDELVRTIHSLGGESALFRLLFLMMSSNETDLRHFSGYVRDSLRLSMLFDQARAPLEPDNSSLPADSVIGRFAHNVLNPSLSRKLYNPGCQQGYVVYGLLRPRVLVSMPFKGATKYFYDVFSNSLDVATSLNMRGYFGTFLMFDCVHGLSQEVDGIPAWLIFFSLIATHSDLVLFIEEGDGGLTDAQRMEAALTPDRVPKKIVTFRKDELTWAKHDDTEPGTEVWHLGKDGLMSEEESLKMDAEFAMPLIESYERGSFPDDRLIILRDNFVIEVLPDGQKIERHF